MRTLKEKVAVIIVFAAIIAVCTHIYTNQVQAETPICIENPAACADEAPTPEVLPAPQPAGPISPAPVVTTVFGTPEPVAKVITNYYPTQEAYDQMVSNRTTMEANYISCAKHVDQLYNQLGW